MLYTRPNLTECFFTLVDQLDNYYVIIRNDVDNDSRDQMAKKKPTDIIEFAIRIVSKVEVPNADVAKGGN